MDGKATTVFPFKIFAVCSICSLQSTSTMHSSYSVTVENIQNAYWNSCVI